MERNVSVCTSFFPDHFPIMGVCGASSGDKIGFTAAILPHLLARNLRVAVVIEKTENVSLVCQHAIFAVGYDLELSRECCVHTFFHKGSQQDLIPLIFAKNHHYDLVLVIGESRIAERNIRLLSKDETGHPDCDKNSEQVYSHVEDPEKVVDFLCDWLAWTLIQTPLWGCVLIGGKSSRMGTPKHLIKDGQGVTWLERTVKKLSHHTEQIVLAGKGKVPESLGHLCRIPDIPGAAGPLSGILATLRWQPEVSWLLIACDMPNVSQDALLWLTEQRRVGIWATIPTQVKDSKREPLLAYYDFRSGSLFEKMYQCGSLRVSSLAEEMKVATPYIPKKIEGAWRNVNTPDEFKKHVTESGLNSDSTGSTRLT